MQHLTTQLEEQRITGKKNEVAKVIYKHSDNGNVSVIMTPGIHCHRKGDECMT